ncbi:hypothetical protein [Algoriphagus formosus]|uniref:hypothetical protein n=1 Tax=Algoriphagus formosus TaxID=2007308 RepID=UPI003F70F36E
MRFNIILFSILLGFLVACGEAEIEKPKESLSEQQLKFEIYDSLVVDYLGTLELMDVSPDGNMVLLTDPNTNSILITDQKGEIIENYKRFGEGPDNYSKDRYGNALFINSEEYLIPVTDGLYRYDLKGNLQKVYKPDFSYFPTLIIYNGRSIKIKNEKVYALYGGRYADEFGRNGIEFQKNSTQLEIIDLNTGEFEGIIPFPQSSKFSSSSKAYSELDFFPNFDLQGDSLFLVFRNEPRLFSYHISDFGSSYTTKNIPFESFVEKEPEGDKVPQGFSFENLFNGTINKVFAMEDGNFLIDYLSGLSKEEFNQAMNEAGGDINKIWPFARELNEGGYVLFDGSQLSPIIEKPEILGTLNKYVSKNEIWFSLNFSEAENDYSVIYKTKIVAK